MAELRGGVIAGVVEVVPVVHGDDRGRFVETYRREWFPDGREMVQGNRSDKSAGVVVGLHFHRHQADYWYVPRGRARVCLYDLRVGSPTEGVAMSFDIGEHNHHGVYIPPGVGHGFGALEDLTITYLVDNYYDPADELGVLWSDPALGLDWGVGDNAVVSERDRLNPTLTELAQDLPTFSG
jgi:dTDP-4-dehydrorhamnose 3,5-epimerase